MRTSTNTQIFAVMNVAEIRTLANQQTEERLDIAVPAKKNRGISTAAMWNIHRQRKGLHLRNALR